VDAVELDTLHPVMVARGYGADKVLTLPSSSGKRAHPCVAYSTDVVALFPETRLVGQRRPRRPPVNPIAVVVDLPHQRDRFRSGVATLPPGPLRDVLTAVAYARDEAARTGATTATDDRWQAVVTAAERAVRAGAPVALRIVA
jgi:hypothetical protein